MGLLDTGYVGPKKRGSGKGLLDAPSAKAEELAAALAEAIAPASMRETQAKRMAAIDRRDLRGLLAVERGAVDNALAGLGGMAQLGIFAGAKAKTADMVKLAKAQEMVKAGADPLDVWRTTGWTDQFPDRKWRFEIDDSGSIPRNPSWGAAEDLSGGNLTTDIRQRVFSHPKLSAAYPDTKRIGITLDPRAGEGGQYSQDLMEFIRTGVDKGGKPNRSTMLHELQHAIQQREGFARGGSPASFANEADPSEAYRRLAGEAEARLVQQRMNLTPEQRAAVAPWQQFDVPREQQIVRGLESGSIRPELLPWLIGLGAGGMYGLKKSGLLGGDD